MHASRNSPKRHRIPPPAFLKHDHLLSLTTNQTKMKQRKQSKSAARRRLITLTTLFVLLSTLYFLFSSTRDSLDGFRAKNSPVKVYMYDLPDTFTYGVIDHFFKARGRPVTSNLPNYPSHQHSAEWHLFADLIKPASRRVGSPIIRVKYPDKADIFFVPFFSSLSVVVNKTQWFVPRTDKYLRDPNYNYSDDAVQELLMEWLERQPYWRRNRGMDHVFVAQNPNAMGRVMSKIRNGVLLVSDPTRASLVKDVLIPYSHRISEYNGRIGVEERKTLLYFRGNRYQSGRGQIRESLFEVLENEEDIIMQHGVFSKGTQLEASQGMHTSKFCLHPAGNTPASCRLFDAIVSMCIPVIVSDDIELPFEDVIDYRKIAVFVNSTSAVIPGFLANMLRNIPTEKVLEYQLELKSVKKYFHYGEDQNGPVNEIWRQVSQKVPLIKLMISRDKRLVKRDFTKPDCSCFCCYAT